MDYSTAMTQSPLVSSGPGWLVWVLVIIFVIIVLAFAYFSSPPSRKNMEEKSNLAKNEEQSGISEIPISTETSKLTAAEKETKANRLESNYLAWITMSSIFLAAAFFVRGFERYNILYSLSFLIIVIMILFISSLDYLVERNKLQATGIEAFLRLDFLAIIVVVVIFVILVIIYDVLTHDEFFQPQLARQQYFLPGSIDLDVDLYQIGNRRWGQSRLNMINKPVRIVNHVY